MEYYIDKALELYNQADVYILAALGLLAGLAGIAKLTKNKTDDKIVKRATDFLNKVLSFVKKPVKKEVTK